MSKRSCSRWGARRYALGDWAGVILDRVVPRVRQSPAIVDRHFSGCDACLGLNCLLKSARYNAPRFEGRFNLGWWAERGRGTRVPDADEAQCGSFIERKGITQLHGTHHSNAEC